MKKLLLFTFSIALTLTAMAQISLTSSMAPAAGTTYFKYDGNVPSPAFTFNKSGTVNTWDFTTITTSPADDDTVFYINPATAPGGSSFPDATHASYEGGDGMVTFLKITASAAYVLGIGGDVLGNGTIMGVRLNIPVVVANFPYTYNSTVISSGYLSLRATGSDVGQPTIDSVKIKNTISFNNKVLAAGNMIVPSGTFPSLLEIQRQNSIDSTWIKASFTGGQWMLAGTPTNTTDSTYHWYSDQSLEPYAHVIYENGSVTDVNYHKSFVITSVKNEVPAQDAYVYPNPAKDKIRIDSKGIDAKEISLFNATGELVFSKIQTGQELDIQHLCPGIYFLKITSNNGSLSTTRFIKM